MKTSFGSLEHILKLENKPVAEYLVFEKEGRRHKHLDYETFVVLSGSGQVIRGDENINVEAGDIVTIPPKTTH
ncbi:MAG: cupin domain-containing protein, partial [Bdellovibrionales bacterium]|nr:cupin domain-containing protein [Bdellovibrionales bacterium]